jgi:primosomal protein N' (replication factor Y)
MASDAQLAQSPVSAPSSGHPCIAKVIVELPLEGPLDYRIPPALQRGCVVGQRVMVPVGPRELLGYIVDLATHSTVSDLKALSEVLDETPVVSADLLRLTKWVADYYLCSWGQVLKAAMPEGFRERSASVYELMPQARQSSATWPAGRSGEVLRCLEHQGAMRRQDLAKAVGADNLADLLRRLQERGLVGQTRQRLAPRVRKRTITMVRLLFGADAARTLVEQIRTRAPNQAKVLAFLLEQPTCELKTLRRQVGGAPAAVKRLQQRGVVEAYEVEDMRRVVPSLPGQPAALPVPNEAQRQVLEQIEAKLAAPDGTPVLLHGITGSGKTEVYMRAIASLLRQGKSALVLVPEIALTEQLVQRFAARFDSLLGVLHSGLSGGERFDEWRRLARGDARIAIGTRSAVFAPLQRLGLLVVDEEHDTSYKQEEAPRYNARDVAIVRAQQSRALVILGSATPAVESFHNAQRGKYLLLSLPHRIDDKPLPAVTLVDQRAHVAADERIISGPLKAAIAACLERREQCLILINRRGFAAYLQCRDCGAVPYCDHCSVALTYHRGTHRLRCHYCGFNQAVPTLCTECESASLRPHGLGTQQVESVLSALFPAARLARMDRDTTRAKAAHQRILRALGKGDLDILVGTQMIAKGHDYPNITLVGVVSADASLSMPDFRAPERLFQLLTQVAGRAGRGQRPGHVLMQTYRPEHDSIAFAYGHDFTGFFQHETARRRDLMYPPFTRLARLIVDSPKAEQAEATSQRIGQMLQGQIPARSDVTVLGPAEAPIAKLHDRYRWHLLVKSVSSKALHQCLTAGLAEARRCKSFPRLTRVSVDIDPVSFL